MNLNKEFKRVKIAASVVRVSDVSPPFFYKIKKTKQNGKKNNF
jgi:hypothetical protein